MAIYDYSLLNITPGKHFSVDRIDNETGIKKRLNDLGVTRKSVLVYLFENPFRNMKAYLIKNTVIALRNDDASHIFGHAVKNS